MKWCFLLGTASQVTYRAQRIRKVIRVLLLLLLPGDSDAVVSLSFLISEQCTALSHPHAEAREGLLLCKTSYFKAFSLCSLQWLKIETVSPGKSYEWILWLGSLEKTHSPLHLGEKRQYFQQVALEKTNKQTTPMMVIMCLGGTNHS